MIMMIVLQSTRMISLVLCTVASVMVVWILASMISWYTDVAKDSYPGMQNFPFSTIKIIIHARPESSTEHKTLSGKAFIGDRIVTGYFLTCNDHILTFQIMVANLLQPKVFIAPELL